MGPFGVLTSYRYARVVELVDSLDSGSSVHYAREGSSPSSRTKKETAFWLFLFCCSGMCEEFSGSTPSRSEVCRRPTAQSAALGPETSLLAPGIRVSLSASIGKRLAIAARSASFCAQASQLHAKPLWAKRSPGKFAVCSCLCAKKKVCLSADLLFTC